MRRTRRTCKGDDHPAPRRSAASARRKVVLVPAGPGTGVKAGPGVRDVLRGLRHPQHPDQEHGSTNPINLVKATIDGLLQLRTQRGSRAAARSASLVHGPATTSISGVHKRKTQEARRPRHRLAATARPPARGSKGQWRQRRRQAARAAVRRRPDAAVPPHPQARLQPRQLGRTATPSSTSATSTSTSTTATRSITPTLRQSGLAKGAVRRRPHPRRRRADQEADRQGAPLLQVGRGEDRDGQAARPRSFPAEEAGPQQDEADGRRSKCMSSDVARRSRSARVTLPFPDGGLRSRLILRRLRQWP